MKKVGRPTLYRKTYPKLLEKILSEGGFNVTFCAEVGVSEFTFYEWVKKHKEFSKSSKIGATKSKALFLGQVVKCAFDPENNKCNNGMVSLLAVNVHGMVTKPPEEDKNSDDIADALKKLAEILPP